MSSLKEIIDGKAEGARIGAPTTEAADIAEAATRENALSDAAWVARVMVAGEVKD